MGGWAAYLASSKKVIVAMIDGRGTGNGGDQRYVFQVWQKKIKYIFQQKSNKEQLFRQFEVWRRLGTVEIEDQIAVTEYLIKNLPIIDPKRVRN